MKKKYLILDCFVDEPACLGVPPFISPYPRYIFGALVDSGAEPSDIDYATIDSLRNSGYAIEGGYDTVFLIGGAVVPGRYLGSRIGSLAEMRRIVTVNPSARFAVGGLISRVFGEGHSNAAIISGDIEKYARSSHRGGAIDGTRTAGEISRWSVLGAGVVRRHPDFPDIICEIETYRGCPRLAHCSFCSEGLIGRVEFRDEEDIISEIETLIKNGVSRFRIGRQADILLYKTRMEGFTGGFPVPNPQAVKNLFRPLAEMRDSGLIRILNVDNANPGTIVNHPDESSEALSVISGAVTPGDTLALGIESFDPEVIAKNSLKVDRTGAVKAVAVINEVCGSRHEGIPALLPGINLVHGLEGESMKTFEENFSALEEILGMGLLVKRINIRRLLPFPGTPLYGRAIRTSKSIENRYEYYKKRIREEIEGPMLKKIYPPGTVLKDCRVLEIKSGYSYGKQIASYSITSKMPLTLETGKFYDAAVIAYRERSVLALPVPISLNTLPEKALALIPGIGMRRAADMILRRPFASMDEASAHLESVAPELARMISL